MLRMIFGFEEVAIKLGRRAAVPRILPPNRIAVTQYGVDIVLSGP